MTKMSPVGLSASMSASRAMYPLELREAAKPGQLLAVAHPQRPIDPGFLGPAPVVHERLNAMPIRGPTGSWIEAARHYGPEFVGADGRRPLGWFGVVGDDRSSFGTKSLS